ncbi:MAG TPA: hypothetical protein EYN08_01180, partial [Gammaproteobacteria bacterium]|nr:hypothetical protein [Gammaproteobacteria bacterium]
MYLGLEKEEIERCELNKEARTSLSQAATFQDQDAVHEIFSELRREDPASNIFKFLNLSCTSSPLEILRMRRVSAVSKVIPPCTRSELNN